MLKKGVFALRTIDDALEIRKFIKDNEVRKAAIIGGGLLGLELAKQIKDCNLETTVVEFFPRLLPFVINLWDGSREPGLVNDFRNSWLLRIVKFFKCPFII